MKKFLIFIVIYLLTFVTVNAEEVFKITAANFDISNSLIVLNSPDESTQPILSKIKLVKLDNPKRAYFDIPSSILTIPKQDWSFNVKGINRVKINQFSTNPNTVRVVMYYDDNFNISNLEILRLKNNIIIKFHNPTINDDYFHKVYRDEHSSANDFYESLTVEVSNNIPQDNIVGQIQQAFNTTVQQTPKMDEQSLVKKDLKLNTKYYVNKITPRQNAVLLSGFGTITIEKPLILSNPSRIVFDIPNAVVNRAIRNSEFQLNETDSVKIGQFEVNKARLVITTADVTKYIPVYSTDNQSVLIANVDKVNHKSLFNMTNNIIAYKLEKINDRTSAMILSFNHPLVHGINRLNNELQIYLYNTSQYNEDEFVTTLKKAQFSKAKVTLLQQVGMKINIPLESGSIVNTYMGADSRTIKLQITEPKKIAKPIAKSPDAKRTIVLDAGHGGADCGATRENVYEKTINLDITKRVQNILVQKGYRVELTRSSDETVSLSDRVEFSEKIQPDIFVSIHVNSSEKPEITGIETHYYNPESLQLAQTVHESMASNIKTNNRGLFKSKFYVINHTTSPAILVEIGFLSNATEREDLLSEKRKNATAKAIAEGVMNYFK